MIYVYIYDICIYICVCIHACIYIYNIGQSFKEVNLAEIK